MASTALLGLDRLGLLRLVTDQGIEGHAFLVRLRIRRRRTARR